MKREFFLINIIILISITCLSQQIDNVRFEQDAKKVHIYYDIIDAKPGQTFDVEVIFSQDNEKSWSNKLKSVIGDVGAGIKPGYNKKITWDVLQDVERLVSEDVVFKVIADIRGGDEDIEMVYVEGDSFTMGSYDGESDEKPPHRVTVSSFYMGKYEVTQKQWKAVMGSNPSNFKDCDNCPVENVSWNEAQEFIKKLNAKTGKTYRLPTEAEWEYACRAETTTAFYTGSCLNSDQANYDGNYPYTGCSKGQYRQKTTPVGSFAPNAFGLYDMHGNVWEWCQDWYASDYYSSSPANNPQGPLSGSIRVLRGGSWGSGATRCRSAYRDDFSPDYRYYFIGFRVVSPKFISGN